MSQGCQDRWQFTCKHVTGTMINIVPYTRLLLDSTSRALLRRLSSLRVVKPIPPFSMRRAESTKPIAIPRPSASLVVVNKHNEILLIHRNPQASSFGGFHVSSYWYAQVICANNHWRYSRVETLTRSRILVWKWLQSEKHLKNQDCSSHQWATQSNWRVLYWMKRGDLYMRNGRIFRRSLRSIT